MGKVVSSSVGKIAAASLVALVAFGVRADRAVYPLATGDLADDANWLDPVGQTNIPHGVDTDWELTQNNGDYTLGADVEMISLAWLKTSTLDARGRKVTFHPTAVGETTLFPYGYRGNGDKYGANCGTFTIRGGLWDFGSLGELRSIKGYNRGIKSQLVLCDGAVMTNVYRMQVGNGTIAQNQMRITGGSCVYCEKVGARMIDGGSANLLEVSGGGKLVTGVDATNWPLQNGGTFCTNLVVGVGSLVSNNTPRAETYSGMDSRFIVDDGAEVFFQGPYWNQTIATGVGSSNNTLRVSRNAKFRVKGTMSFNQNSPSHDNLLEVLDGATFECNVFSFTGSNSTVFVSNATLACTNQLQLSGHGNELRISGDSTTIRRYPCGLFNGVEGGNRLVFDAAAYVSPLDSFYYVSGESSPSNSVEIVNGSDVTFGTVRLEAYSSATQTVGHTLLVAGGSTLRANNVLVNNGNGCRFVISNGTYVASGMVGSQNLMFANFGNGCISTNNEVVLAGETPKYDVPGNSYFRNGSRLVFAMPPTGYATPGAVLQTGDFVDDGTTRIEITGVAELKANLKRAATYELIRTTNGYYSATSAQMAAMQNSMPENCRVYVAADRRALMLHVVPNLGTTVILR